MFGVSTASSRRKGEVINCPRRRAGRACSRRRYTDRANRVRARWTPACARCSGLQVEGRAAVIGPATSAMRTGRLIPCNSPSRWPEGSSVRAPARSRLLLQPSSDGPVRHHHAAALRDVARYSRAFVGEPSAKPTRAATPPLRGASLQNRSGQVVAALAAARRHVGVRRRPRKPRAPAAAAAQQQQAAPGFRAHRRGSVPRTRRARSALQL